MIQPTGHKILLFLGNFLSCMDLVISRFVQLEVQLSIFMRQSYFEYSDTIPIFFGKMGNLTGAVKSWKNLLHQVHFHPVFSFSEHRTQLMLSQIFSRMVEMGYPLSNLRVKGVVFFLLFQGV